jgi:hypothetical protein
MADVPELRSALGEWAAAAMDATRRDDVKNYTAHELVQVKAWEGVHDAVLAISPPSRRPDLYHQADAGQRPRLRDVQLLRHSGMAQLIESAAFGLPGVDLRRALDEFADAVEGPALEPQTWLLVDADVPDGLAVRVGDYELRSVATDDLERLVPVPSAYEHVGAHSRIDSEFLAGAGFLVRPDEDRRPGGGLWFLFSSRPELEVWRPLITMQLWRPEVLQLEAQWRVEPGRRIDTLFSDISRDIRVYEDEDSYIEIEYHRTGEFEIESTETTSFAAFIDAVDGLIGTILGAPNGRKPDKKTAKRVARFTRAAQHIVRASQRSHERGEAWGEEADEIVLHYVIAMEALLSDEDQLDLSRKVAQRAAALGLNDDWRTAVLRIVKSAYIARSKYAHGDEPHRVDLPELRRVTLAVMLRWLVVQAQLTHGAESTVSAMLDETLLCDARRAELVEKPLATFFTTTPPRLLPRDVGPSS